MGPNDEALDSDAVLLSGESPCVAVDSSFSHFINTGYVSIEEKLMILQILQLCASSPAII
jgi:hypothetical protein